MTRRLASACALSLAVAVTLPNPSCAATTPAPAAGHPPVWLNAALVIPKEEIPALKVKALNGDPQAARRLVLHYGSGLAPPGAYDFWLKIGAENGDPISQYTLGMQLLNEPDRLMKFRGVFWLKSARKLGVTGCEGVNYPTCDQFVERAEKEASRP